MARTNPHHDWDEPQTALRRSNGAEWESLRNELVALLDQVEDQVATSQVARPLASSPAPSRPVPHQANRHSEALRSVRQAVTRLADRAPDDRPVMRDSVVDAISQIRARQTGGAPSRPQPAMPMAPASAPQTELAGFAKSLDAIGEKIAGFEERIGQRLESLGEKSNIAGQIDQLSEVIELLAGAVGETGQIKRIEAQIGNLAEMIAADRQSGEDATSRRIEELTATIEKLVTHQLQASENGAQQAALADDRQEQAMAMIEQSVRSIYDRIDSLEASQSQPSGDIERLSRDMAALTEAVSRPAEPTSLLAKIDALSARISTIEAPSRDEAAMLAESVSVLRDIIAQTIEPRFADLEKRMDTMAVPTGAPATDAIESQLRQIAKRVDETSVQLKALASLEATETTSGPDLEALAELIATKTKGLTASGAIEADGIEKADLTALEDRLATLFAQTGDGASTASSLSGVRNSIAQVDNRIARLEAMLNSKPDAQAVPAEPVASPPSPPRRKRDDAMPIDPATGAARRVLGQGAVEVELDEAPVEIEDIAESEPAFAIDPAAIDRPAKPKSSLAERESPFEPSVSAAPPSVKPGVSNATRASFIEAARRSARQPVLEQEDEPKSLIGRALARFQRDETDAGESQATDEPVVDARSGPVADLHHADIATEDNSEKAPGFFARNRRSLLLGTALVAVIVLAAPLVMGRIMPSGSAPASAESAQVIEPASAAEESEPVAEVSATQADTTTAEPNLASMRAAAEAAATADAQAAPENELTSHVRVIEQQPRLSAASLNSDALTAIPTIDPVTTAAVGPANSYATTAERAPLPPITAPVSIEPAALRAAADEGDRFAQFEVGAILTEGTVVEQDFAQAAAWYERSAAQGFAPAQYRLGSLYEGGRGVDSDLDMARLWYQRAAEAGNRMSMHNLASLYAGGELEDQDFAAAAHWFEEAAGRGLTDSQFNLGMLYARGLGVEQDFEQSYIWFSLAARSGDEDAANSRDDVARSLDADAIQRLDNTIAAWAPVEIDIASNFAPIGTWDDEFDPGPAITNRDVVMRVQMLLGKLGYDIGTPDGIPGPKTREAVAAFERATSMNESGAVNPRLLAVLGSQPV